LNLNKNVLQQRIKIIAILCSTKGSCVFATSEFPSEIPRTQTRNYPYTKPLPTIATLNSKRIKPKIKTTDFKLTLLVFS